MESMTFLEPVQDLESLRRKLCFFKILSASVFFIRAHQNFEKIKLIGKKKEFGFNKQLGMFRLSFSLSFFPLDDFMFFMDTHKWPLIILIESSCF